MNFITSKLMGGLGNYLFQIAVSYSYSKQTGKKMTQEVFLGDIPAMTENGTFIINGIESEITGYDLSPKGIREYLKLDEVKYKDTCTWGHFGRGFGWE